MSYAQWFALLTLKHFSPEMADGVIRHNTLKSLVARGLAAEHEGLFFITPLGIETENGITRAPRS